MGHFSAICRATFKSLKEAIILCYHPSFNTHPVLLVHPDRLLHHGGHLAHLLGLLGKDVELLVVDGLEVGLESVHQPGHVEPGAP